MKTLTKLGKNSDNFGSYAIVFRNEENKSEIVNELRENLRSVSVFQGEGTEIVVKETVPSCSHEYDCCGCVISKMFIIREMFTECHVCINV